jgi:hypothetical protein
MEELNGPSLAAVVAVHGPLPVSSVLTLAAGLAETLSAAHAADAVYTDLSPASVLLTADGPRLTGFAISRAFDRWHAAGTGALPVTPGFTPPEWAEGREAGPASDIYSLGAVLLYAATGAWMSHFAGHLDQLPGELRPIIERCLAADPARRPAASELLTSLTAARPAALSHVDWLPAGILATGTGAPAPFGTQVFAPPFPAQIVGKRKRVPWPAAPIRRHAGLIAIAVLAFTVALAGTMYVVHPWPYPVLRPTGLTADQRGANSIGLGWSNPGSGPPPDKYVILRDGAVAATVPGNVNHFTDGGLAPATTYDFQVIAYRGSARSQPSPDLRAATRTPPLSEAVFHSIISVTEKIESGGDSVSGDKDGQTWFDAWTLTSDCAVGPCATHLYGSINGNPFSAVLKPDGHGNYTGSAPVNDAYYCGNSASNTTRSTLVITVTPRKASAEGTRWQATQLVGTLTWEIDANPNGNCSSGELVIGISG